MRDFVVYTLARFALFGVCYAAVTGLYLLVLGSPVPILWPLLIAAILSTLASAFVLRGLRERVAVGVQQRAERMSQRFEQARAKEDGE